MNELAQLADLLRQRNAIDSQISALIGRPSTTRHLGEFIAARLFDIQLMESASHKGIDGYFTTGLLIHRSVNIKFYLKQEGVLDISEHGHLPDYLLVLTGPTASALSSRGQIRPFCIHSVYLFDAPALVADLQSRNVRIGTATSIRQQLWKQAEIYPTQQNQLLVLSADQRYTLSQFKWD